MLYLALGALVVWIGMVGYRRTPGVQRGRWRVGAGLGAAALATAGTALAVRGAWLTGGAILAGALVLALAARSDRSPGPPKAPAAGALSDAEARSLLGVGEDADPEAIQAAYSRLMRVAHPDRGGTSGLAAQINAARDRLLKR